MILSRMRGVKDETILETRDSSLCQSWVKKERRKRGRIMKYVFNFEE
jgi:hypothetical protein